MSTVGALQGPLPLGKIKHEKLQMRAQIVTAGVLIGLIVSGLYFGVTQVHWYIHLGSFYWPGFWLKHGWDDTTGAWLSQHVWFINPANWTFYRHNVRDLGIPAMGIFGVMSIFTAANYSGKQYRDWRLLLSLVLFFAVFVVLVCVGTYLGLILIHRPGHVGSFFAAHDFILWVTLGIIMSQILHRLFGPVGASLQSKWVELAVDNWWRKGGGEYPAWVRRNYIIPVTARRRFDQIAQEDWMTGEAKQLMAAGPNVLSKLVWWAAGLVLPAAVFFAVLGFIGHFLVGVAGMSVPYLAP
jgi:hypothetical protein